MNIFLSKLKSTGILLADGAMGTELQKRGLKVGECPELYNLLHPNTVKAIHQDYFNAGSDIVETNTFGANQLRLKFFGLEHTVRELNLAAVDIAKSVKPSDKFIAGSVGPLGEILVPLGTVSEDFAYQVFAEQAAALDEGGVDILFIETMMSIEEAIVALKAAKENTNLPIAVSMTFQLGKTGISTPWGVDIITAVTELTKMGADIIGSNCGNGFDEMIRVISEIKNLTNLPVIAQSNAGIPVLENGNLVYKETPEMITKKVKKLLSLGINILGGCCGTTPLHIIKMRDEMDLFLTQSI